MSPRGWDRPKFCVRHLGDLEFVITHSKVEIGLAGHHDRPGGDRTQRSRPLALEAFVHADIGVLPRPEHRKQVVWIAAPEETFDERNNLIDGAHAEFAVLLVAEEVLREGPSC